MILEKLQKKEVTTMKKFLLMFFLAISLFTLGACGNNEAPPEEGEQIEEIEEEDEIGDGEIDDE
jgi:predicted small lipoprotein YifL